MYPVLSVIILNFNTRNFLEQCLQSVAESKGFNAGELEVIVVDNGSTDGSKEMVLSSRAKSRDPTRKLLARNDVILIENKTNLGFEGGNNAGIKQAKGKYLLLLNSDTTVYSDTLIKMVKFADGLPELGAATCRVELPSGKIDPACHRGFPTPGSAFTYLSGLEKIFPRLRLFSGYHQGWKNLDEPHQVDVIAGSFFLIPKKVADKVGLLDESFFMYGEDIDWCWRIKQAGYQIWYNPEAKIIHYKKQSGRARGQMSEVRGQRSEVRRRADFHFVYTMEQFYRKHYIEKYPKLVNWLVLASINFWKRI